ncbi:MAG TPA: HEAT repeat domain-containing protein, partial [Lacunisphaera sp.]|nr:HEAT repeat domain-containing protein [Lacunisphaera sp.]
PTCQREWSALQEMFRKLDTLPAVEEPSPRLREQFYAMLETHQRDVDSVSPFALARGRIDRFFAALLPSAPSLQFAGALAVLAIGVFAGARYFQAPAAVRPATQVTSVDPQRIAELEKQLADQRDDMKDMGSLVAAALSQQKSTSERLKKVLEVMDLKSPDRQKLTDLIGTLALDPSVNVRLQAVEALSAHADQEVVRQGLLANLSRETAPIVQVAMIDLLASVRETGAAPLFERFSRDESADKNVRESARRGLVLLRSPSPTDPLKNNQPAATANPSVS